MMGRLIEQARAAGRAEMLAEVARLREQLVRGQIQLPRVEPVRANLAGGTNHAPNSDHSYSRAAATVPGTLPGAAGDDNQEAYRVYRQQAGADVTAAPSHALKAAGHSGYAAGEGADGDVPDWDRVNGWVRMGSPGTQYDVAVHLLSKIVNPGQRWFFRLRAAALDPAALPAGVEFYAGFWHRTPSYEGWVTGSDFALGHTIEGAAGSRALEYRVLAKTDSGVAVLSQVLAVPDAPAALSASDYVKLFYNPGPGFIEFEIYRREGGVYTHLYTVRNSTDFQYNDTDNTATHRAAAGWPAVSQAAPMAYAQTRGARVAGFGAVWAGNDLTIDVPSTYDFSQTDPDGLFLRYGLTAPAGVDRHVGVDRIWLSTTYNEWGPDVIRLPDGSAPVPSVSPTSGNQGGGGGVIEPPPGGGGGGTCVAETLPVLTAEGTFRRYRDVYEGDRVRGAGRAPALVLAKRGGEVCEFVRIRTANGIVYECSTGHRLVADLKEERLVEARHVRPGARLRCWVAGRRRMTTVVEARLVPRPLRVGTFSLRDLGGERRDGDGLYVAGRSKGRDRGLYGHNAKPVLDQGF